jgi:Flp pilus assembly protein TadD
MWNGGRVDSSSRGSLKQKRAAARPLPAWGAPVVIAAITFVAFLPALQNGFVSWDDQRNFVENPHFRGLGWAQLSWMWTTFHMGHYVPLSWMTLGFDYAVWGMNPLGYHLTSLLIHTANAVLVYVLAERLLRLAFAPPRVSERRIAIAAALGALLFAVHPLRVESVAWATERRDVLSLLFYLVSTLAYLRYATTASRRAYAVALGAFVCALLSKATSMTLPAVLLLLNVYPLRRFAEHRRQVILELVPFAALSAASALESIIALHPPNQLGVAQKIAVSAYSLVFYVWKTILPTGLSPLYEMPQRVVPTASAFLVSYALVIALCAGAWMVRRRAPALTAAWAAFVLIGLPMLGVVQNGPQIAADRYTYHAAPALAILVAVALLSLRPRDFKLVTSLAGAAALLLALLTWDQTQVWHDSESLWTRVLDVDPNSSMGHSAWATLLFKQNRVEEALAHSRRAVELAPGYAEAHNDLGVGLARIGEMDSAVSQYKQALAIKPEYDEAENNLGIAIVQQGNVSGAVDHYKRALELNPENADAHVNWGNALVRLGRPAEAETHYREALEINPADADAHHNWGVALAQQGKFTDAIVHFQRALAIAPNYTEAAAYLAQAEKLRREQRR